MAAAKAQDAFLLERLRAFQRSDKANKRCADCTEVGPTYVCLNFGTLVCSSCSGLHREFGHRIKGISMSKWTLEEVEEIEKVGNARAAERWMARWKPEDFPEPDGPAKARDFLRQKYVEKRWESIGVPAAATTAAGQGTVQGTRQVEKNGMGSVSAILTGHDVDNKRDQKPAKQSKDGDGAVAGPLTGPAQSVPTTDLLGGDSPAPVTATAPAAPPTIDLLGGDETPRPTSEADPSATAPPAARPPSSETAADLLAVGTDLLGPPSSDTSADRGHELQNLAGAGDLLGDDTSPALASASSASVQPSPALMCLSPPKAAASAQSVGAAAAEPAAPHAVGVPPPSSSSLDTSPSWHAFPADTAGGGGLLDLDPTTLFATEPAPPPGTPPNTPVHATEVATPAPVEVAMPGAEEGLATDRFAALGELADLGPPGSSTRKATLASPGSGVQDAGALPADAVGAPATLLQLAKMDPQQVSQTHETLQARLAPQQLAQVQQELQQLAPQQLAQAHSLLQAQAKVMQAQMQLLARMHTLAQPGAWAQTMNQTPQANPQAPASVPQPDPPQFEDLLTAFQQKAAAGLPDARASASNGHSSYHGMAMRPMS